ncbi:MAG TPA: hypothetical protein VKM56_12210 [Verrucomicrobiae bacterium]|nr:hypothetical protein [Verrucomicrobiae bacterium]
MMARTKLLLAAVGCSAFLASFLCSGESTLPLRVLYVGHRPAEFEPVLKTHFAKVESTRREGFKPQYANDFDVVVLDWPQSDLARLERGGVSPLGKRQEWSKPTVLLGSAGLNLAVAWKVNGGSG